MIVIIGVIFVMLYFAKSKPIKLVVATATRGGTYYPLGHQLARILEDIVGQPIEKVIVLETHGSNENVTLLLSSHQNNKADIAFVHKHVLHSDTTEAREKVRVLAKIRKEAVQIIVRSDASIQNLRDLKGKRIYIGSKMSGTRVIANEVLNAVDLNPSSDIKIEPSDSEFHLNLKYLPDLEKRYLSSDFLQEMEKYSIIFSQEVSISTDESGTRWIITDDDYGTDYLVKQEGDRLTISEYISFKRAAEMLVMGELDAAFFVAGIPDEAVEYALMQGPCKLLDLENSIGEITSYNSYFDREIIPVKSYSKQTQFITTLSSETFLVGRKNLSPVLVSKILDAIFDNIDKLLMFMTNSSAQDMRIDVAFQNIPDGYQLHKGAIQFRETIKDRLQIVTGSLTGKYYEIGKTIQDLLARQGLYAKVLHTDGSVENARLLGSGRTLAIMQYDVAIAVHYGLPEHIYKVNLSRDIELPQISGLRRIATLHKEMLHIVLRREEYLSRQISRPTVKAVMEEKLLLCQGPEYGGTRLITESILQQNGISEERPIFLTVPNMVDKLQIGEIDGVFMVSQVPSKPLNAILDDERMMLLSVEPQVVTRLVGTGFVAGEIGTGTYSCQQDGEPEIRTLETRAVLVTTDALSKNTVKKITKTIFEGAGFLGIIGLEGSAKILAENLPSLPLHDGAEEYYREMEYLPSAPKPNWTELLTLALAVFAILMGGSKGLIVFRREKIRKFETREVRKIPVDTEDRNAVGKLLTIRDRIQKRVEKKWWNFAEINHSRWRELENLIQDHIKEARLNLTMSFLADIRKCREDNQINAEKKLTHFNTIEKQIWSHLEKKELDDSQHDFLQKGIDRLREEIINRTKNN